MRRDVVGKKFNRWTVLEEVEPRRTVTSGGHKSIVRRVSCRCDCGTIKDVDVKSIVGGSSKSCGCWNSEAVSLRTKLPEGESASNVVFYNYKRGAETRGIFFDLTKEDVLSLVKQNCAYCGTPPDNISKRPRGNGNYVYNGIDRKDNALGYTKENSIPCCKHCNYAKRDRSVEEFIDWAERVVAHSKDSK